LSSQPQRSGCAGLYITILLQTCLLRGVPGIADTPHDRGWLSRSIDIHILMSHFSEQDLSVCPQRGSESQLFEIPWISTIVRRQDTSRSGLPFGLSILYPGRYPGRSLFLDLLPTARYPGLHRGLLGRGALGLPCYMDITLTPDGGRRFALSLRRGVVRLPRLRLRPGPPVLSVPGGANRSHGGGTKRTPAAPTSQAQFPDLGHLSLRRLILSFCP
jgi:hypothetical protein